MSSGNLTFQIIVDSNGAVHGLGQVEAAMKRAQSSVRGLQQESNRVTNQLGRQSRATNLAGQSALEVSRIASDAAYEFRGMANNIGQVATLLMQLGSATDEATGKTLGFVGSIKALGRALWGPMGVLVLIQLALSLYQMWQDRTRRQRKEQEKLNKELERTSKVMRDYRGDLIALFNALDSESAKVSRQAEENILKLIPRFEQLRNEGLAYDEILKKAVLYQGLLKEEKELSEALSEAKPDTFQDIILQNKLNDVMGQRLALEAQLIGVDEEVQEGLRRRGHIIDELTSKALNQNDVDEMLHQKWLKRIEEQRQELEEFQRQLTYMNYGSLLMFGNESLNQIAVFGKHIDAVSASVSYLGDTFGNLSQIGEEQNKELFRLQQAFAIASVTMDTIRAVARVQAETGLLGTLMSAAIIARGVAQVSAIATQKLDGSSNLRGAKGATTRVPSNDNSIPVVTTGFSNLEGGERPGERIRVYVTDHDLRTTRDRSDRTKVRARL